MFQIYPTWFLVMVYQSSAVQSTVRGVSQRRPGPTETYGARKSNLKITLDLQHMVSEGDNIKLKYEQNKNISTLENYWKIRTLSLQPILLVPQKESVC